MKFTRIISHRGNLRGINHEGENRPEYLIDAIAHGFDVEVDLWEENGSFYFGHDVPQYKTSIHFMETHLGQKAWFHCKNPEAYFSLVKYNSSHSKGLNAFYHTCEDIVPVVTPYTADVFWCHNLKYANDQCVIPLLGLNDLMQYKGTTNVCGVCTDVPHSAYQIFCP